MRRRSGRSAALARCPPRLSPQHHHRFGGREDDSRPDCCASLPASGTHSPRREKKKKRRNTPREKTRTGNAHHTHAVHKKKRTKQVTEPRREEYEGDGSGCEDEEKNTAGEGERAGGCEVRASSSIEANGSSCRLAGERGKQNVAAEREGGRPRRRKTHDTDESKHMDPGVGEWWGRWRAKTGRLYTLVSRKARERETQGGGRRRAGC